MVSTELGQRYPSRGIAGNPSKVEGLAPLYDLVRTMEATRTHGILPKEEGGEMRMTSSALGQLDPHSVLQG